MQCSGALDHHTQCMFDHQHYYWAMQETKQLFIKPTTSFLTCQRCCSANELAGFEVLMVVEEEKMKSDSLLLMLGATGHGRSKRDCQNH